jgi:hypothetical protein
MNDSTSIAVTDEIPGSVDAYDFGALAAQSFRRRRTADHHWGGDRLFQRIKVQAALREHNERRRALLGFPGR